MIPYDPLEKTFKPTWKVEDIYSSANDLEITLNRMSEEGWDIVQIDNMTEYNLTSGQQMNAVGECKMTSISMYPSRMYRVVARKWETLR